MKRGGRVALGSALAGLLMRASVVADEDHGHETEAVSTAESSQSKAAQRESEALRAELEELRATVELLKPSLTRLMPDFAERFHVTHRAGDAEDWAVGTHELLGMQQVVALAKQVEPDRAALFDAFMAQPFEDLESAIEHTDRQAFDKALTQTIQSCNGCHQAVGSPFIEVVLDARTSLSMRHPLKLDVSKPPREHTSTRRRGSNPRGSARWEPLDVAMPRWSMSEADLSDLVAYLSGEEEEPDRTHDTDEP